MRKFFKTVAIVTVFSVCEKFLGFLYRIYLSRSIGAEGVGVYQVALTAFAFLMTLISSGTPVTVSRLITKYRSENQPLKSAKVITAGISVTFFLAVVTVAFCYLFRGKISSLFADERCGEIFFTILPSLIFVSVYSVLRGVFWGNKDFLPYSLIELTEEIVMIISGIIIITVTGHKAGGAFGAGVAVAVSFVASFTLAFIVFFVRKNKFRNPRSEMKNLIAASAPVTAMRTVNSLGIAALSVILPLRLVSAGFTESQAMSLFGSAAGQAVPLLFVPSTLITSFTLVLIPEISENYYGKKRFALKSNVERALKFTTFLSCAFIPLFTVCGEEIGLIVFGSYDCGKYLTASAFLVPFIGLSGITTSILNSVGCEKRALVYCIISGVLMLLSVWFLPKFIGIYALLVGFSFVYVLTTILNLMLIGKKCPEKPEFTGFFLLSAVLTLPAISLGAIAEKLLLKPLGTLLCTALCTALVTAVYLVCALGCGLADIEFIKSEFRKKRREKRAEGV
ncbi:MAG: oligosaccharide flippase family protein [Clostridia bacterium]|nr:oligosaccharide flippase family protein [Clostridia bacterium]